MGRVGRPRLLGDEHLDDLRAVVREHRGATIDELCVHLHGRIGVRVCGVTLRKALLRAGLSRVVPPSAPVVSVEARPKRYGYQARHRIQGDASRYATCLTDAEWALAADLFDSSAGGRGRPIKHARRAVVDACCYVLRTGCSWRMLPKSFPPWPVVYKSFLRWARRGKFEQLHARLRQQWRERMQRSDGPSAAIIDSQSNRISPQGGSQGFDAGKKVKGRKRHLVVDTLGLLLAVSVTAASVQDRDGAPPVVAQACSKHPTLQTLFVDSAYAGKIASGLEQEHQIRVEVVRRPSRLGTWDDEQTTLWPRTGNFVVLPKRWVVERTHAWVERWRRLIMHHDRSTVVATAWVWLAQGRLLTQRLTTLG